MVQELFISPEELKSLAERASILTEGLELNADELGELAARGDSRAMRAFAVRLEELNRLARQYKAIVEEDAVALTEVAQSFQGLDETIASSTVGSNY